MKKIKKAFIGLNKKGNFYFEDIWNTDEGIIKGYFILNTKKEAFKIYDVISEVEIKIINTYEKNKKNNIKRK